MYLRFVAGLTQLKPEVNTPLTALGFDSAYSLHVKELQCLKLTQLKPEVNTPLTALGFDSAYSLHVKELQCLKLYQQLCTCQPHLIFGSYPNLQVLDIPLDLDELRAYELFTIQAK